MDVSLTCLFQFDIMDMDGEGSKWNLIPFDLMRFKQIINDWQHAIDWNTLFWGNHDQPRVVSRFGSTASEELRIRSAKMLATAMYLLRGTPFLYQGEEIGMTNYPFADESELRDIESINLLAEARKTGQEAWAWNGILAKGRDNARTPMQWNTSENAGFTTGTPWIGVNPNYKTINIHDAAADPDSVLNFYRDLIELRNSSDALKYGDFELLLPEHPQLFAYRRSYKGESFAIYCNFSVESCTLPAQPSWVKQLEVGTTHLSILPLGTIVVRE